MWDHLFLDFFLMEVFPVIYSEHDDVIPQNRMNYTVVVDAVFPKARKLPFGAWACVSFPRGT
jgi:hypothetical protein